MFEEKGKTWEVIVSQYSALGTALYFCPHYLSVLSLEGNSYTAIKRGARAQFSPKLSFNKKSLISESFHFQAQS